MAIFMQNTHTISNITSSNEIMKIGGFNITTLRHGLIFDEVESSLPSRLLGYTTETLDSSFGSKFSTIYGYVQEETITILTKNNVWPDVPKGFYFCIVGEFKIKGKGSCVLFERIGVRGIFQIGGPLENIGRVAYISGCSDSLLVFPPRMGDPCMNCLWFPKNVRQTMHIHPTVRFAIVTKGNGRCITPEGELPLKEGYVFKLKAMSQHCFFTDQEEMTIVTYHPDSDWGPTDDQHPMLNKTLLAK